MFADLFEDLRGEGAGVLLGLVLGGVIAWVVTLWRRYRQRQSILKGDARDTVVIAHHLVEASAAPDGGRAPAALRIRTLGQSEVSRVVPNGYLASELLRRAFRVTPRDTLISMEGAEGSYLLEALTNFVFDRVANAPFEHDLYVMAPCCEPAGLAEHQPITILLVSVADLKLFEDWPRCKGIRVEHGGDGTRILTLMELARRYRAEQAHLAELRQAGQRTRYVETMYVLDLALDRRSAAATLREVPWSRFEDVLKQLNLP
jgi:hypothetical protein